DAELLALFRRLGVQLERRKRRRGLAQVQHFGGVRKVWPAGVEAPARHVLREDELALGEQACLDKYFALAKTFDPHAPLPAAIRALDQRSGAEFLRAQGASESFIASVDEMIGTGDRGVAGMSALSLVQTWALITEESALGP